MSGQTCSGVILITFISEILKYFILNILKRYRIIIDRHKLLFALFISTGLVTCIDPYSPDLNKSESLIVVDALLTDGNRSNYVYLSLSGKSVEDKPEMVSGAVVLIKDDLGNITALSEMSEGIYITDSLVFRGEAGRSYKLYIKTSSGDEYESESCLMYPVQDIDSIYITRGERVVNTEIQEGIWINIDAKDDCGCRYYRWKIEEWWKFSVPFPKVYNYVNATTVTEYTPLKRTCWANNKSYEIIIKAGEAEISDPILFIASEESDRLLVQYHITVTQLSISAQEYEFWENIQKINETGGDIFDKQPFQVYGNIHSISNKGEKVLGYFQVSSAKIADRYITRSQLKGLGLPDYKYDCGKIELGPVDFIDPVLGGPLPTLDQIYSWYNNKDHTFVWPLSLPGPNARLVFVNPLCADCTLRGSMTKPDFWVDIN